MTMFIHASDTLWFQLYLPVANIQIVWPGLLLLGLVLGFISGYWKIGGGWLLTPGLNALGLPMSFAVGTSLGVLAGSSLSLLRENLRYFSALYFQAFFLVFGAIAGIESGARMLLLLEFAGLSGPLLRWGYEIFLGLALGAMLFSPNWIRYIKTGEPLLVRGHARKVRTAKPLSGSCRSHRSGAITQGLSLGLGLGSGVLSGVLGTGIGLLRSPLFQILPDSTKVTRMTSDVLMKICTGLFALFTFTLKGRVDPVAVLLLLPVFLVGARIGKAAQKDFTRLTQKFLPGLVVSGTLLAVILKQENHGQLATVICLATSALACIPLVCTAFSSMIPLFRLSNGGIR